MASIWNTLPDNLEHRLRNAIKQGLADRAADQSPTIFFRADDIGVPGDQFERLMTLFVKYRAPLALALVPAWLTPERWRVIQSLQKDCASLFCWHQHGWRHTNHEPKGKKQEFGPARTPEAIRKDLISGKKRLMRLCGADFSSIFTPPWNRCTSQTLSQLKEMSFSAVSRRTGNPPPSLPGLPEIPVDVDLHTRKDINARSGWAALFTEFSQSIARGRCGVMIHHQHMNENAFAFLELLLRAVVSEKDIYFLNLKTLCR